MFALAGHKSIREASWKSLQAPRILILTPGIYAQRLVCAWGERRTQQVNRVGAEETRVAIVNFAPDTSMKMHTYSHEQILYILSSKGVMANEQEEHMGTPSTVFPIPAGEKHWRGPTQESSFSHPHIFNSETETTYWSHGHRNLNS